MVIVFDTDKARAAMVPVKGAAVKIPAARVKELGGARGMIPLSACRFTGGNSAEILAAAKIHAGAAGVKDAAVASFFRFNTAALRRNTIPYGDAASAYFAAAKKGGATLAAEGITRAKKAPAKKAPAKKAPRAKK